MKKQYSHIWSMFVENSFSNNYIMCSFHLQSPMYVIGQKDLCMTSKLKETWQPFNHVHFRELYFKRREN